jgi:putative membrane-bound dehydrogenase-like protein
VLFTGIGGMQHDHGIHAFHVGPDGKLYFNMGNEGRQIKDKEGRPIVDRMGREVNNSRQPYQEGMVFRCNIDGSEFETLAWNFRNNWEVCVDSFGTMWQSDNDDDGNRGVRINYVMDYGNYGYKDELTGAWWGEPRTNIEAEIPRRHWHLNDPGVIPNLLQTGAGAPTGICVYEGDLLPAAFRGALIHTDAGPNICRAYRVTPEGAGYQAEVVDIIDGSRDQWFRPSDVCVAPDGSLIVADWYDPGVGGHRMQDVARGRLGDELQAAGGGCLDSGRCREVAAIAKHGDALPGTDCARGNGRRRGSDAAPGDRVRESRAAGSSHVGAGDACVLAREGDGDRPRRIERP